MFEFKLRINRKITGNNIDDILCGIIFWSAREQKYFLTRDFLWKICFFIVHTDNHFAQVC